MSDLRDFLESVVYHTGDRRRYTQQSPVMPDVWISYGMDPGEQLELLLVPDWHYTPAALAAALKERLEWGIHFIQVHPMGCGLAAPEQECEIARIVRVAAKPTHTRIHCGGSLRAATPRIGRATQPHAAPEQ